MKKLVAMLWAVLSLVALAGEVTVTSVTAKQRYPWNGLVDIAVTIQGVEEDLLNTACTFAATNSATGAAIPIAHITQNGDDTGSGNTWMRKFIWDAKADVGAVKIDDVALTVYTFIGVQLWANGPCWATCNVGATKPEEYGYYFWWGDTVGYKRNASNSGWISVKDSTSFSFNSGNCPTYGMYNSQLQSEGYVDATGNLVAAHDAATAHLGAPWRMPTDAEFSALINNCDTEWTSRNGVSGRLVKGRGTYASRSIFLPAAGCGNDYSYLDYPGWCGTYWFSTPYSNDSIYALNLSFYSDYFRKLGYARYYGQSVRPVRGFADASGSVIDSDNAVTTHLSLDTRTWVRLVSAGSTLSVDYSPDFSSVQDVETVRVLTNDTIWVESAVGGTKDFTFGNAGLYQFTHQVLTNGVVSEEIMAWYAVAEAGRFDIPDTWTEIPDGLFKNCDGLTSVTIPSSVTNIAPTAFAGCDHITNVVLHGGVSAPWQLVGGTAWIEEPETLAEDKVYKSNVITHKQSTAIEFVIPEGMGRLVFSWKVGSEYNYDWLTWYLDDVQKDRISGSRDWAAITNELDGAAHRLKFVYSKDRKDRSASTSPDCGWVSVHALRIKDIFPDSPLAEVAIGDEVEALPDGFFAGCEALEVVALPERLMSQEIWDLLSENGCVRISHGGAVWNLNNRGIVWPEGVCQGEVEVPASQGGLDIAKIADGAFAGMTGITAIEIGEGIVALGDGAFDGCTSLSSIALSETLEDFGDNDVREIGRRGGKSGLWVQDEWVLGYIGMAPAEVTIPDGVKGIAAYAFEGQNDLERVVLPDSLKFIGKDAFAGCTSLEGLDLPEGCGRIDDGAFRDCTWIQEVSLASGLTNIGAAAFANCAGLSVLIAPEGLKAMGEGAFSNCWRMVSASLSVSLDEVGANCFWNCKNLSGVTVPTHVQPLKTLFPAAYDALTSIVLAEGEDRLVEGAFDGCAAVKEIVLPDAVTEIPAAAFRDCVSLERMAFPAAVKEIGDEAFAGCVGLTRLNLTAGLEAIGARAFEGLSELQQVAIPDGVTAIGAGAFAGCGAVRQVRLPGNVTTLAAAFPDAYAKIVRAEVPEGTTELIAGLFDGCATLESFAIPASVTDIGARAFAGCGALKAVALPQGLKTIGDAAFSGVSGILELEIPSSVESLGAGAFTGCAALRSVTLPGDVGALADIFPDAYEAMVSVTVTEGAETLNDGFFAGCVSLKTVELPTSVAEIGAGAFEDCTSLASVGIPAGVTSLGAGAFRGCSALAEVTLPGGLGVLEDEVFADCALLASVTVPESVTTLGSRVFDGCAALRLVKFIGNAPQVAADAYAGSPSELVTQVATGSRGWDGIATSRNLPEFWPSGTTHGIGWWDPTRFEVTFDYNDGSGASETVEEITDTTYKLPDADPVHPGAAFLGWWTETVNGARVSPVTRVMRTSAHTLYAHWRPFSYTVTFDANGGTGTMEEQAFVFDEEQPLRACAFTRIGYAFAGWAVGEGEDRMIDDGETVRNLTTEDGGTVRLYAVWTEREWSAADYLGVKGLVFVPDGDADWFPDVETSHDGVGSMRSGEIGIADAGETTRSTLRTTVAGKGTLTFWWKVNCEGPDPDNGDFYDYLEFTVDGERPEAVEPIAGDVDWMKVEVRIEGEAPTHELAWSFVKDDWDEAPLPDIAWVDELTWTPDPVTVTFDGNGATEGSVPAAVTSAAGAELVLPGAGTLRKGPSKFVGWSDGKRVYAAGETYVVGSAGVTLSAVWEEFTIADALNTTDLVFATGGDAAWTIDFETSHDGAASMRSGAIGTSQTSWIETTVDGAGSLTFVWKVDGLVYRNKPANYVQYAVDGGVPVQVAVCDWTTVEVEVEGAGEHTIRWAYLHTRAQTTGADCAWLDEVKWVEAELPKPIIEGDEGATVTGDVESGFIVKPSEGKTAVEVTIPQGVDAAKVTVEVSPKVASVKPNGAKVKVVSGGADITEYLNVPAADEDGVVDLTKATVKAEIVKEAMDPEKGAEIKLDAANPLLTTPNTRVGLFYQLREGETLGGMKDGDSTVGDGQPWTPEIKVKGGNSAFYSIEVGKGVRF